MIQKRKEPNKRETYLSLLILVVLIAVGAMIYYQQLHYSPAVLRSDQTSNDISLKSQFAKNQSPQSLIDFQHNLIPLASPEVFGPKNLSNKINGKAELYLSAGFKRLESQRFRAQETTDEWMEVFIYDMGSIENAFSVFSQQQRDDAQPADFGQFSYKTQNALYWVHGPFYVEIIASIPSEIHSKAMADFARAFVGNIQVEAGSIDEQSLFPQLGLDQNSITLISADAFGFAGFDRVFIAGYKLGASELTAFISKRNTALEARQLASAYREFLLTYGGNILEMELPIKDAEIVMILDAYEIIFTHGPYLAGIREATDKNQAIHLAGILKKKLEEVVSE